MWLPLDKVQSVNMSIDRKKKKSKIGFLNNLKELLRWHDFGIKQNPKPAHALASNVSNNLPHKTCVTVKNRIIINMSKD